MKLPYQWLKDFTDVGIHNVDAKTYADSMTMSGSMVGSWESPADEIKNVVVGQILKLEKHPNSDHLHICTVDVGEEAPLQIVCGAPNVKEGILVPVAKVGAKLPGGFQIKKGKLRGVESYGMLCSGPEIGVPVELYPSVGDEGLLIFNEEYALGTDVRTIFGLDDYVVDFETYDQAVSNICQILGIKKK